MRRTSAGRARGASPRGGRRATRAPRARSARSSASSHGSATRTTCGWSRSQPSRAARPSRSPRERPPASSSKKSLIRFFSVSCSITWIFLIADRDLARDRAAELDAGAALGDEQPEQLAVRDERHGEPRSCGRRARAPGRARRARASARAFPARDRSRPRSSSSRRRVEQVDVAGTRAEQRPRVRERPSARSSSSASAPRDRLGELGELLELGDAQPRLLVEARVLDRAGDERRAT